MSVPRPQAATFLARVSADLAPFQESFRISQGEAIGKLRLKITFRSPYLGGPKRSVEIVALPWDLVFPGKTLTLKPSGPVKKAAEKLPDPKYKLE